MNGNAGQHFIFKFHKGSARFFRKLIVWQRLLKFCIDRWIQYNFLLFRLRTADNSSYLSFMSQERISNQFQQCPNQFDKFAVQCVDTTKRISGFILSTNFQMEKLKKQLKQWSGIKNKNEKIVSCFHERFIKRRFNEMDHEKPHARIT